jgi:hypothetical protein
VITWRSQQVSIPTIRVIDRKSPRRTQQDTAPRAAAQRTVTGTRSSTVVASTSTVCALLITRPPRHLAGWMLVELQHRLSLVERPQCATVTDSCEKEMGRRVLTAAGRAWSPTWCWPSVLPALQSPSLPVDNAMLLQAFHKASSNEGFRRSGD